MTLLVTGAQGFVGSHLLYVLKSNQNKIYALKHTAKTFNFPSPKKITWLKGNLTKPHQLKKTIQTIKPDVVYHLAAQSSVADSWQNPSLTFKVNVLGTLSLLENLIALNKKCRFVVVESGEVYGRGNNFKEESPLTPENPYAASKAAEDLSLYPYLDHPKVEIIRARPFNHIGPGQSNRFVVGHFAFQIAAIEAGKRPPEIHVGNLKPKRDFTDVRDVVQAYALLAKKGKKGEIYNICSGKLISIEKILHNLLSFSKIKIKVKVDPTLLRKKDILSISASADKLKRQTGWKPKIPLQTSLLDTLNFYRKTHS